MMCYHRGVFHYHFGGSGGAMTVDGRRSLLATGPSLLPTLSSGFTALVRCNGPGLFYPSQMQHIRYYPSSGTGVSPRTAWDSLAWCNLESNSSSVTRSDTPVLDGDSSDKGFNRIQAAEVGKRRECISPWRDLGAYFLRSGFHARIVESWKPTADLSRQRAVRESGPISQPYDPRIAYKTAARECDILSPMGRTARTRTDGR